MIFKDRKMAGIALAAKLARYVTLDAVLLAIPRGGVPVAEAVAEETGLPLRLFYVKKIGHPRNREFAIGAVGLNDRYLMPTAGIGHRYIDLETAQIRRRLETMKEKFGRSATHNDLRGKTCILVDDGIATGNTLLCAVQLLRKGGAASIVIAAPVAARSATVVLNGVADAIAIVHVTDRFNSVGEFFEDFHPVADAEVLSALNGHLV